MISNITTARAEEAEGLLFDSWFDPIEDGLRAKVRGFIETMIEEELTTALSRPRYGRRPAGQDDGEAVPHVMGHRHGRRTRRLTGTFGPTEIRVPRARLVGEDGMKSEWKSAGLRAYQRRTLAADALIAATYLAGTNTRRVRRALAAVFADGVGKDVVSRVWRKVRTDWDAWNARPLRDEPMVRLILDGTVVRVRLDRKATSVPTVSERPSRPNSRRACPNRATSRGHVRSVERMDWPTNDQRAPSSWARTGATKRARATRFAARRSSSARDGSDNVPGWATRTLSKYHPKGATAEAVCPPAPNHSSDLRTSASIR